MTPFRAIILAAGLGTRLQPFTLKHPKALAIVNGKTVLQRNVEYLQHWGITDVIVNVHHFANQIIDTIHLHQGWGSSITISDETSEVLETGGGIAKAGWFLSQTPHFVVMNADILCDLRLDTMMEVHLQKNALATLATTHRTSSRQLLFNQQLHLCGWKNTKTGETKLPVAISSENLTPYSFSGIHVVNTSIFSLMPNSGKFSMIDTYLSLCNQHLIAAFDHSNGLFIDIGTMEKLAEAQLLFT